MAPNTKTAELTVSTMPDPEMISNLVLAGDLSKMDNTQRVQYYNKLCQSLGLNPLTQPFQILKLNGKEVLYAKKDCTEQLRKIYCVSVTELTPRLEMGLCWVTAKVQDAKGRTDCATGAVNIENLKGENLANALMKAETKAKRRATLSICGLGMLDESELDTMPKMEVYPVNTPSPTLAPKTVTSPIPVLENEKPQQETQAKPEAANIKYATAKQKEEIIRLLNNVVITRHEKTKMLLVINTLDEERAAQSIQKLRKVIEEREEQAKSA